MGYDAVDNGWMRFSHYRIPRTNLLRRFAEIDKEGNLDLKGDPRTVYQIMVQTRQLIIYGTSNLIFTGLVMATRYAACRRQFATISGSKQERKLLDYQTHMAILGPQLANAYTFSIVARNLRELNIEAVKEMQNGKFKLMDILHHFTSGLKAICTEECYNGID